MKTNLFPTHSLRPSLALPIGLFALFSFAPAAHAQGDNVADPDILDPYKIVMSWENEPSIPVPTATGKEPGIADFARAFMKQYPDEFTTAVLAKLDGRDPQLKEGKMKYLLDPPHGYLKSSFYYSNCSQRSCNPTMEMCYWRIPTGHRLVAVSWSYIGNDMLLFYDYSPETKRMTPLKQPPFKDFYDNPQEMIVELPRQGKDIQMKPARKNGPQPLTLRWNGLGGFTTVGASERYRKPAASNDVTFYAEASLCPLPYTWSASEIKAAPLYDAPGGKVTRRLTTEEQLTYLFMIARVKGKWVQIKYTKPERGDGVDEIHDLLQGKNESRFRSAWVPLSTVYVNFLSESRPDEWILHLYAEPSLASRRICTFSEATEAEVTPWVKLLEARKGWVKVQILGSKITGWIEARQLHGNMNNDCR